MADPLDPARLRAHESAVWPEIEYAGIRYFSIEPSYNVPNGVELTNSLRRMSREQAAAIRREDAIARRPPVLNWKCSE